MPREPRGVLRALALKGGTERPANRLSPDLSELCMAYCAKDKRRSNIGLVGSKLGQPTARIGIGIVPTVPGGVPEFEEQPNRALSGRGKSSSPH